MKMCFKLSRKCSVNGRVLHYRAAIKKGCFVADRFKCFLDKEVEQQTELCVY